MSTESTTRKHYDKFAAGFPVRDRKTAALNSLESRRQAVRVAAANSDFSLRYGRCGNFSHADALNHSAEYRRADARLDQALIAAGRV